MDTHPRRSVVSLLAGALLVCAASCSDGTATEVAETPPPPDTATPDTATPPPPESQPSDPPPGG